MLSINDILNRPPKPFNVEDFGGLQEDEYIKDEIIYCKKCNTPRLFVQGNFKVRCLCTCQAEDMEKEKAKEREAERLKAIEQLQAASLIGERYKNASFKNTETGHNASFDNAFIRCKRYCEATQEVLANGLGIYLYGDCGVGKTHLTACMANELIQQRKQVLFTNFAEILKMIKSTFNKVGEDYTKYIEKLATIDFLFIDDLGTERMQGANGNDLWLQEIVFDIINKRHNNQLPTIFTANDSLADLIEKRGFMKKTVDRIAGMSHAVLKVEGASYRMKARAAVKLPF